MDIRITEQKSNHRNLEHKSVEELTYLINQEDYKVSQVISGVLPQINKIIEEIVKKIKLGGRLFYVGAGSGGRLSVLDCIELPTTFGIEKGIFNVILAGGVEHLAEALEEKEDDTAEAWLKLQESEVSSKDIVIGISASGTTPFVIEAIKKCRKNNITTACIVSNTNTPIARYADFPIEIITGPEFITGSTRMKCGTAQKMVFDIISTTSMIQLGLIEDNSMVNVALINNKITDRAIKMLMEKGHIENYSLAKKILLENGSVKKALQKINSI